jgi:hypothetical protein
LNSNARQYPVAGDPAAERAELARLLPAASVADLPDDRHRLLRGYLMDEIARSAQPESARPAAGRRWPDRLRLVRRPRLVACSAATVAVVLAGTAAVTLLPADQKHSPAGLASDRVSSSATQIQGAPGDTNAAVGLLIKISEASERGSGDAVRDNQFIYVESLSAYMSTAIGPDGKASSTMEQPHKRQIWFSVNGSQAGWLVEAATSDDPRNGIVLDPNPKASLNAPTYRYLESLPTDPDQLLKKIYEETKGMGTSPDHEAFVTIGDLLRESLLPPKLAKAVFQAAAKIPNVVVVNNATDAAGRKGIAVAHVDRVNGDRSEWIFDERSFDFLGERSVQARDQGSMKAGTLLGTFAVLKRAVVNKVKELPQ